MRSTWLLATATGAVVVVVATTLPPGVDVEVVEDGAVVLLLAVLHHQLCVRPTGVDGEPDPPTAPAGIAQQPVEAVLAPTRLTQGPITQANHSSET